MPNNDFSSLLSTFRKATSSNTNDVNNNTHSNNSTTTTTKHKKPLKEVLNEIYNTNQIRHATAITSKRKKTSQHSIQKNGSHHNNEIHVHIAICICIVDSLPHEKIWKYWIEETGGIYTTASGMKISSSAELYIHAKFPDKIHSSWVRSKTLKQTFKPNWNDYRVIQAMIAVASKALDNNNSSTPSTSHIQFCTESCIPITSLKECATKMILLQQDDKDDKYNMNCSFFNYYSRNDAKCTRFDEHECFDPLSSYIPPSVMYKALPGWITLSKTHMMGILNLLETIQQETTTPASTVVSVSDKTHTTAMNPFIKIFERVWAPEEVFFATCLGILGKLDQNNNEDIHTLKLMYVKWDDHAKGKDQAHPIIYSTLTNDIVQMAKQEHCLFLRKIKNTINLQDWIQIVLDGDDCSHGRKKKQRCVYDNNVNSRLDDGSNF